MPMGVVLWFDRDRGYGFIKPQDKGSPDVHLCIVAIEHFGLCAETIEGLKVSYRPVKYKGLMYAWKLCAHGRAEFKAFPGTRIDTTVRWFNAMSLGFGFLEPERDYRDLFVSGDAVVDSPLPMIGEGDRISCLPVLNRGRWEASELRRIRG